MLSILCLFFFIKPVCCLSFVYSFSPVTNSCDEEEWPQNLHKYPWCTTLSYSHGYFCSFFIELNTLASASCALNLIYTFEFLSFDMVYRWIFYKSNTTDATSGSRIFMLSVKHMLLNILIQLCCFYYRRNIAFVMLRRSYICNRRNISKGNCNP